MSNADVKYAKRFEQRVRDIARLMWSDATGGRDMIDGREVDGLFLTPTNTYHVEATTSRQASNASDNAKKITKSIQERRKQDSRQHTGWIVTRDEPTPDQRSAVREAINKTPGTVLHIESFRTFSARLVDAAAYLSNRENYRFGSAHDPGTGGAKPEAAYVAAALFDSQFSVPMSPPDVVASIQSADEHGDDEEFNAFRAVVQGDYGMGKSMLLRDIFSRLSQRYLDGKMQVFPLAINLRDHHGQDDPAEAILRHANRIGFKEPAALIRAWRAGFVVLLLDGYDEIAPQAWGGKARRPSQFRNKACTLIRRFIEETPSRSAVIVAGRSGFFSTDSEMKSALGTGDQFRRYSLCDFTTDQVREYLMAMGYDGRMPDWLPRRPLLIGYLAAKGHLDTLPSISNAVPTEGWSMLLDAIAAREAQIDSDLDGDTVRRLVDRLGTLARKSVDGLGPLSLDDLRRAYTDVCGFAPSDNGEQLLLRLFCLTRAASQEDAREFVDRDISDVARAGDVLHYIQHSGRTTPEFPATSASWNCVLGRLGVESLAMGIVDHNISIKQCLASAKHACEDLRCDALAAEILWAVSYSGHGITEEFMLRSCETPPIVLEDHVGDMSKVTLRDGIVPSLYADSIDNARKVPGIGGNSYIGTIEGEVAKRQFGVNSIEDAVEVGNSVCDPKTNAQVLEMHSVPLGVRVLVVALKKLFVQRGAARKQSAFARGLDAEARVLVDDVLGLIIKHKLAYIAKQSGDVLYVPMRDVTPRAMAIIANHMTSRDPIVLEAVAVH